MNNRKSFIRVMLNRTLSVALVFSYGCILSNGSLKFYNKTNVVNNINNAKSVRTYHLVTTYEKVEEPETLFVANMDEASKYGPVQPISFTGQMTAYKATCKGCTGRVACPPGKDVTNNIWYEDSIFGKIRILAADRKIPCGTIVKITNVSFSSEPIIGIVLDRGGAIKGNIMDFLVGQNDDMDVVGRQKGVNYEVLRWGW